MGAVVALDALVHAGRVWRGQLAGVPELAPQLTGHDALDAALPAGGWPPHALTEILLPADGVGEVSLVWLTLARLTRAGTRVVLVASPYRPHAPAWARAGVALLELQVVHAAPREALWAMEQCLGFAFRDARHVDNPSRRANCCSTRSAAARPPAARTCPPLPLLAQTATNTGSPSLTATPTAACAPTGRDKAGTARKSVLVGQSGNAN